MNYILYFVGGGSKIWLGEGGHSALKRELTCKHDLLVVVQHQTDWFLEYTGTCAGLSALLMFTDSSLSTIAAAAAAASYYYYYY